MAAQDKGPAGGALVGVDESLGEELETRVPAWDQKRMTAVFCLIIGWFRRGADARKQAAAPAAAASDAAGASSEFGAPKKVPPAVDDPRAAVQRTGDSADEVAAAAAVKGY